MGTVFGIVTCDREYLSSVADALAGTSGMGILVLIAEPRSRDKERLLTLSDDGGGIDFDVRLLGLSSTETKDSPSSSSMPSITSGALSRLLEA